MMRGSFLPFKFIGYAAYPIRPWFYSHFKGEMNGLPRSPLEFYPIKHMYGRGKGIRYSQRKMVDFTEKN